MLPSGVVTHCRLCACLPNHREDIEDAIRIGTLKNQHHLWTELVFSEQSIFRFLKEYNLYDEYIAGMSMLDWTAS